MVPRYTAKVVIAALPQWPETGKDPMAVGSRMEKREAQVLQEEAAWGHDRSLGCPGGWDLPLRRLLEPSPGRGGLCSFSWAQGEQGKLSLHSVAAESTGESIPKIQRK